MNLYNLNEFQKITPEHLLNEFKKNNTIKNGCINVFGDTIGKPGDIIYVLHDIELLKSKLKLNFGKTLITIYEPNGIVINEKVIGIIKSTKVLWEDEDLLLEYEMLNRQLITHVTRGQYYFDLKENKDTFLFYMW